MAANQLRKITNRVGAGLKAFIQIHEPGPMMVSALLAGAATLFAVAYAIGHWA